MTDLDALRAALPAYAFEDVLGRGAWGVVVAAHHRRLDRPVAVKMLPLAYTQEANVRRRFATEARLLAALDHPHIVRIHDYIEQDEICALVMERLTGSTLAERMAIGRIPLTQATAIQLATLHGLEHAHQHGVLHRDIKPENLMFAADGVLKITDFGIATVLGDEAERLTAEGVSMGTPAYMAPEQLDDATAVGGAADIWAAAAVFYEMLSGDVPYPSRGTLRATLLARTRDEPRPIDAVEPAVPRELGRAIMRALDRNPAKRFATSEAFADQIEQSAAKIWGNDWLAGTSMPVYRTAPRSSGGNAITSGAETPHSLRRVTGARTNAARRRRKFVLSGASAAVIATGVAVAVVATGGGGNRHASSHGPSWGSWVSATKQITAPPILTARLGTIPSNWGSRLEIGINLDAKRVPVIGPHFGSGITAEVGFVGDPINGPSWNKDSGKQPAADAVRKLEAQGSAPYVTYYVQRLIGRGTNDASESDVAKQLDDPRIMKAYWKDVIEFLKELGSLDQPIPVNVEPGVSSTIEALAGDAAKVRAVIASSGIGDLAGLPNTFAGWSQAWVHLRDKYAKKVMLGVSLEPWAAGDYLVPFDAKYKDANIPQWTKTYGDFYRTLGARYDFINYTVAYGEAGKLTTKDASYYPTAADFNRLVAWTTGLSQQTHLRVVLESVPMGNTLMAPVNNTKFHWQDGYAQWLLGDGTYANLTRMRDAGVIGIVFGFASSSADFTCPCDAANDQMTQGVGPNQTLTGLRAASSDDDGGYLRDHVRAYLDAGGMPLS